jgi:hypothetical protein
VRALAGGAFLLVEAWGGEDLNLRPTDYESGHAQALDLQEFLNLLVRSIT